MKTIAEMLKPRPSVFSDTAREDVLDLTDFDEGRIDAKKFFTENYRTQGMDILFDLAFKRFQGKSDTSVIKLTQAMGGGKTHCMLALALLASNIELRKEILGDSFGNIGEIKVLTFSGRENAEYGIWGALAEKLGKAEAFKNYYEPLKAPGESAWVKLLENEKILILLDELPPYLESAKAIQIGSSDLSRVTIAALANLFSAMGKAQLANVCLVFSDLKATYESGSELLQKSFKNLEAEADRVAYEVAPVALNSDEVYAILRKKLFEDIKITPDYKLLITEIAMAFKEAVSKTKKSGYTGYTGEAVFKGIMDSYPFHPSIKPLYERFKENQSFQQTRGLIKLMRQIVRQFYESGRAEHANLINVFDIDLNNSNMLSQFRQIKPSLEVAIDNDVAQNGQSIAELIDGEQKVNMGYAQAIAKLLLVASLSTERQGTLGLTEPEIFGYLSAPEADLNALKVCTEELRTRCWYLKVDNRGRLYFHNTKNMIAEMNQLMDSYTNDNAKKELKTILLDTFTPHEKTCYERLYVLPAIDEISLDKDKITLVIFEPYPGSKLHPDLAKLYENVVEKNRVMFLSGQRSLMEKLYDDSKKLKAIHSIIESMKNDGTPSTDQQFKEAEVQVDKARQALLSTIRETFVTLYYPTKDGIVSSDFKLEFKDNNFNGEEQIIATLKAEMKYDEFANDPQFLENLRKKCVKRIFTTKEMTYEQIRNNAATNTSWQWYHPDQLNSLRAYCLSSDKWRELGGYLVQGPFEKDPTQVLVEQTNYDEKTQEFTLHVRGIGGRVYYDLGSDPTDASLEVKDNVLVTKEPSLRFICIDSTKEHKTGDLVEFIGSVPLKYGQRKSTNGIVMTLATNKNFEIRYTTDGSEPKENGGLYTGEFLLPKDCKFVRAAVLYQGKVLEQKDIPVDAADIPPVTKTIDPEKPLAYRLYAKKKCADTESSYKELLNLSKIDGLFLRGAEIYIVAAGNEKNYIDYTAGIPYLPSDLQKLLDFVRENSFKKLEVKVTFEYKEIMFNKGAEFNNWVELCKLDLNELTKNGEIIQ